MEHHGDLGTVRLRQHSGSGIGGNCGNQVNQAAEGQHFTILVVVCELQCGHAQVVTVHGVQTHRIVVFGEFGVHVTLAAEQIEVVTVLLEHDLGGALVKCVAQV